MFFLADVDKWVGAESVAPVRLPRTGCAWTTTPLVPYPVDAPLPVEMPRDATLARRVPGPARSPARVSHSLREHPSTVDAAMQMSYLATGVAMPASQQTRPVAGPRQVSYLQHEQPIPFLPLSESQVSAQPPRRACLGRAQAGGEAEESLGLPHHWVDGWLSVEQGGAPRRSLPVCRSVWVAPDYPVAVGGPLDSALLDWQGQGDSSFVRAARLSHARDVSVWAWPGGDEPPGWAALAVSCLVAPARPSVVARCQVGQQQIEGLADALVSVSGWQHGQSARPGPPAVTGHADSADPIGLYAYLAAPSPVILTQATWPARSSTSERRSSGELALVREFAGPSPAVCYQLIAASPARASESAPHQEYSAPDWHGVGLVAYAGLGYCAAGDVFVAGAVAGNVVRE